MPSKQDKYCSAFPCNKLVTAGQSYCDDHRRSSSPSKVTDPFYGTARWKRFREWYKVKHPECERCMELGLINPVYCVDHVVELQDGGAPLSEDNAMSLCRGCHAKKTAHEKHKRGLRIYAY